MATASSSDSNAENSPKLSEIFNNLWEIWEYVDNTDESSSSDKVQSRLQEGCKAGEKAIAMVNVLRLFSDNEEIDEVSSNEIRYMLLPALLGYFYSNSSRNDRLTVVLQAQVFYVDFLQMCKNYGVTTIDVPIIRPETEDSEETEQKPPNVRPGPPDLTALNASRQAKIQRFKEMKETESRLRELRPLVEREHVDDEVKREYYTKLLNKWVNKSLEELESLEGEIEIIKHMEKMKLSGKTQEPVKAKPSKPPFRPFILTKSMLQKKVYGAGYPSLPTYTIEEFFDQQVDAGNFPQPGSMPGPPADPDKAEAEALERQAVEKDAAAEADDPESLQKARDWDDWTDDHRRGWGNTQNKG